MGGAFEEVEHSCGRKTAGEMQAWLRLKELEGIFLPGMTACFKVGGLW
jgi:hypothetical protein